MEAKLEQFLNKAFAPYGDFPAKSEITKELLANMVEKYNDLKDQGKSEQEAYHMTTESFGDVSEIMDQLPHIQKTKKDLVEEGSSLKKTLKQTLKEAKARMGFSRFSAVNLSDADLSETEGL